MKENTKVLSCFIDESGDFGRYDSHCPFYVVSAILYDQSIPIDSQLQYLENQLSSMGFPNHVLHAGPLVRRESVYRNLKMEERKKLFNVMFNFARKAPIRFFCIRVKKSECKNKDELETKLAREIKKEVAITEDFWNQFDKKIIYYDNGQNPLKTVLNISFTSLFSDVEVRKIEPKDYRLFQVADLFCTLELTMLKIESGIFSRTEREFFCSINDFKKEYWRKVKDKEISWKDGK